MKSPILIQKSLALFTILLVCSSCNQQEFYKKEYLKGAGIPSEDSSPKTNNQEEPDSGVVTNPTSTKPDNSGDTTTTTKPGDTTTTTKPGICGEGTLKNTSDQFTQNSAKEAKVDILWVIDNSGSMTDEQKALAYNFNAFISNFIKKKIDFKMAITTTDPRSEYSGKMIGDSNKLTSVAAQDDVQQFMNDFSSMIKVGTKGSGNEQGLETSKDFFDRYNNWARKEAYLIVVYVSDEEDHSSDKVSEYVKTLQAIKTKDTMVRAYSIVTQKLDPNKKWESIGTRYVDVSKTTGGEIADIHQDFYATLEKFGFKILDLLDSFPLSGTPIDSKISVAINGIQAATGWSYDKSSRAIKFDKNAIPNEGEVIIAYYQKCIMPKKK